jgi:hypothetical protein
MSDRNSPSQGPAERGRAVDRLIAAVAEQRHLREERQAVKGTAGELTVDASLRIADEQVTARKRWLEAVDGDDD